MQPTQQTVIPVSLYNGAVASDGSTTVTLNPAYDHVICCVSMDGGSDTVDDQLQILDQDANLLAAFIVPLDASLGISSATQNCVIVCQSLTGLILVSDSGGLTCSVSAYRLAPSATSIFS